MLGMSQEQLEQAIHEWFENNQDKVGMFIEGFEAAGADDDVRFQFQHAAGDAVHAEVAPLVEPEA